MAVVLPDGALGRRLEGLRHTAERDRTCVRLSVRTGVNSFEGMKPVRPPTLSVPGQRCRRPRLFGPPTGLPARIAFATLVALSCAAANAGDALASLLAGAAGTCTPAGGAPGAGVFGTPIGGG
ncbi:MAG TPA: hypothetical protein VGE10_11280, partial [Zeimonas sp.]